MPTYIKKGEITPGDKIRLKDNTQIKRVFIESTGVKVYQYDNVAPTLSVTSHNPNKAHWMVGRSTVIYGKCYDAHSSVVRVTVNGYDAILTNNNTDWHYTITGLTENLQTFVVVAYDEANNPSRPIAIRYAYCDRDSTAVYFYLASGTGDAGIYSGRTVGVWSKANGNKWKSYAEATDVGTSAYVWAWARAYSYTGSLPKQASKIVLDIDASKIEALRMNINGEWINVGTTIDLSGYTPEEIASAYIYLQSYSSGEDITRGIGNNAKVESDTGFNSVTAYITREL